jgi:hypothetical protein
MIKFVQVLPAKHYHALQNKRAKNADKTRSKAAPPEIAGKEMRGEGRKGRDDCGNNHPDNYRGRPDAADGLEGGGHFQNTL